MHFIAESGKQEKHIQRSHPRRVVDLILRYALTPLLAPWPYTGHSGAPVVSGLQKTGVDTGGVFSRHCRSLQQPPTLIYSSKRPSLCLHNAGDGHCGDSGTAALIFRLVGACGGKHDPDKDVAANAQI